MQHITREKILSEFFAEECEAIGDENLDPILRGTFRPTQTKHGENMPVLEFVGIVATAVGFIDASLSLYDRARSKGKGDGPGAEEFVALARSELKIPAEIDDQRIESILRRISE